MNKETKHEEHRPRREGRADETDPPLGTGEPEPPFAEESDPFPADRVQVVGDASATYGSMIPPETIRPHEQKVKDMIGETLPARSKKEEKEPEKPPAFSYVDVKEDQSIFVKTDEPPLPIRRYPGEGDPIKFEPELNPGLYVKSEEEKAPKAHGKEAEDERNKKREAKEEEPAKGPHDR